MFAQLGWELASCTYRELPDERVEPEELAALVLRAEPEHASGVGPVVFTGTIWLLSTVLGALKEPGAYRVALLVLSLAALAGLLVLRPLSDRPVQAGSEAPAQPL